MKNIVCALVFCAIATFAQAQTATAPDSFAIAVDRMLVLTNAKANMDGAMHNMIMMMKKGETFSSLPEEFWTDFEAEANKDNALMRQVVVIYRKYFSLQDVLNINAFYESPLGQKMTLKMPLVTQEMQAYGYEWGQELGAKVGAKVAERMEKKEAVKNENTAPAQTTPKKKAKKD